MSKGKESIEPKATRASIADALKSAQAMLHAFIVTLIGNLPDADDILQETNFRIFKESGDFDGSKSFASWARSIAFYEVKSWRQRQRRERLVFDNDVLETVAEEDRAQTKNLEARYVRLDGCLEKLPKEWRQIVNARYYQNRSVQEIADRLRKTPNAVSLVLMRARAALAECITKADANEGEAKE